jgi:glutathione-specific gamma-glutamylcyclotransferase
LEDQAQIIARARGEMGENSAYLFETTQTLASLGLQDPDLSWLAQRVAELTGKPPSH